MAAIARQMEGSIYDKAVFNPDYADTRSLGELSIQSQCQASVWSERAARFLESAPDAAELDVQALRQEWEERQWNSADFERASREALTEPGPQGYAARVLAVQALIHLDQRYDHPIDPYTGTHDERIADFSHAIAIDPQNAYNYLGRAMTLEQDGVYSSAIADLNKVIELDPQAGYVYNGRAGVHFNMQRFDQAIDDYTKSIELEPDQGNSYFHRGMAYVYTDQPAAAIADYTKAIELNYEPAVALINRGVAYGKLGQHELAVADFAQGNALDPGNVEALEIQAKYYRSQNDLPQAIALLTEAIDRSLPRTFTTVAEKPTNSKVTTPPTPMNSSAYGTWPKRTTTVTRQLKTAAHDISRKPHSLTPAPPQPGPHRRVQA